MKIQVISRNVGYALLVSALFMFLSILVSVSRGNDSALAALTISFIITFFAIILSVILGTVIAIVRARQPEATGKIQTNMILTSAFVEGCALFAIAACAFLIK